ncbi:CotH kinase family protein [Viridibacillus sp. YIM B01967]|uniref:CotH kinase family protein n=1 Tax=Viridibacillus soli TaxID=2798301 RepID=A0ABS1HEJ5_9BACL|nr:CotH kinase family protein [Viridibacillus soli]MBK3497418.1 CotH kinase family protein [Viridibacillus soli]
MEKYFIEIPESELLRIQQNIWDHEYVDAKLKTANQKCSIKVALRGNQLREHKKKSYHIIFDKPYLIYGQHEIHLNAEYNDPSLMRNKLSFDFFESIGVLAPHSIHILLYINNVCHGIYLKLESFDQFYLRNRNLPEGSIYYATNYDANFSLYTPEKKLKLTLEDGYTKKYDFQKDSSLKRLLIVINTFPKEEFIDEIINILDVEKYLMWLAGVVCTQNFDGFIHNYALYHNSKTGLFEITPWDYDGTWGRDLHGRPLEHDYIPIEGYNTLTARLLACPKYRVLYGEFLHQILQTQFTVQVQKPLIEKIHHSIRPYIHKDPNLKNELETFDGEQEYILRFIRARNKYLVSKLDSLIKL